MTPRGRPPPQSSPASIDLINGNDPRTILCKEIREMVGEWPWIWLGAAAPTIMDLSWLQSLNLLLGRAAIVMNQANDLPAKMLKEIKYTLLCLASRRERSGGRGVVTNEHLTRAIHYFDIRNLIHDVNQIESDEPSNTPNGFTREWWVDGRYNDKSDATSPSSENQREASPATKKRKASDDPTSTSQSVKA
ncbi:hypothetical protein FPANT_9672 [Fusarium pseudoanthophilum]|uniref:Uncharacterized protein n=1 Tax=Fusarium pseudoanthophilum TaxID=48495 RepID=A0A8H5KV10_9HYPO|nr:hypothetical protein FPANT_9672 [Fusarium pseudoanthophilum]